MKTVLYPSYLKVYKTLIIIPLLALIVSCNNAPSDKNESISLENEPMYPNADSVSINYQKSIITWIGSKPTGQHDGILKINDGYVIINEGDIVGGFFEIDINSLVVMDLKDEEDKLKLTSHLLSDDFFDVKKYPIGTFSIKEIVAFDSSYFSRSKIEFPSKYKPASENEFIVENPNCIVKGALTLRGKTNVIEFPAAIVYDKSSLKAEAKFNINRTEWDLKYDDEAGIVDKAKDKFIYNTVNVGFYLEVEISQ